MKKKKNVMQERAFNVGGAILIAWSVANTSIDIFRYGMEWGTYWWFCNLALFGIGVGLLMRSRGVLTGFLSIACFTQIFWLLDNLLRQTTGSGPFGLVDFMYRPGYPLDEFLLSHYHYFTMPIAVIALLYLPQKQNNTVKLIAIFNPLIFGVSYFAFASYQNINCIHRACFAGMENLEGPMYSLGFWSIVLTIHLIIGYFLNRFLLNIKMTPQRKQYAFSVFVALTVGAFAIVGQDTAYKMSLPSFTCVKPAGGEQVSAGCQYTRVHYSGNFLLTYFVENDSNEDQFCKVGLKSGEKTSLLNSGTTVSANSRILLSTELDVPKENMLAEVLVKCKPLLRATASLPSAQ